MGVVRPRGRLGGLRNDSSRGHGPERTVTPALLLSIEEVDSRGSSSCSLPLLSQDSAALLTPDEKVPPKSVNRRRQTKQELLLTEGSLDGRRFQVSKFGPSVDVRDRDWDQDRDRRGEGTDSHETRGSMGSVPVSSGNRQGGKGRVVVESTTYLVQTHEGFPGELDEVGREVGAVGPTGSRGRVSRGLSITKHVVEGGWSTVYGKNRPW